MQKTMGLSAIGIPWYKRADYARILEIMADRDKLPETFDKWQSKAEQAERGAKAAGKLTVRAHIDPDNFVAWCAANGVELDSHGRNKWAAEIAYRAFVGERPH